MTTPEQLDRDLTLRVAVSRYDELRLRDSLSDPDDPSGPSALDRSEALELLALGELISRKAIAGRQLTVRTARATGASWAQIGQALGSTRQAAWEGHTRWIDSQVARRNEETQLGYDEVSAAEACALAGNPDDDAAT
ncbi:hypothetical protein GCM10023201_50880 [Actinomycetospora corticicola]|uniref:Uncharacterized protein n=1 Tax=Actinomycetospora corticicola TaxID=663602 RepID=A0A7Y9DY86_9PSEU|nr:hypothetical protein [Actinomycetospora corticicola]NYD37646.1 hypothetical protein [Actinomycetospora corticicola]